MWEMRPNQLDSNKILPEVCRNVFADEMTQREGISLELLGFFCYCCFVLFINVQKLLGSVLQITTYWFVSCVAWTVLIRECLTRIALTPSVCTGKPQCNGPPKRDAVQHRTSQHHWACCSQRMQFNKEVASILWSQMLDPVPITTVENVAAA